MASTSMCNVEETGVIQTRSRTQADRKRKAEWDEMTEKMFRGEPIDEQPEDFVYQDPVGDEAFMTDIYLEDIAGDLIFNYQLQHMENKTGSFCFVMVGNCSFFDYEFWEYCLCDCECIEIV